MRNARWRSKAVGLAAVVAAAGGVLALGQPAAQAVPALCTVTIAGPTSSVVVPNGVRACLFDAHVTGSVTVQPGGGLIVEDSVVDGSIVATRSIGTLVCGTDSGSISAIAGTGPTTIGNPSGGNPCEANHVTGSVLAAHNSGDVTIVDNTVFGPVQQIGNAGTVTVSGNHH